MLLKYASLKLQIFLIFWVLGNLLRIDNLIASFRDKDEGSLTRNFDYKKKVGGKAR